MSPFGATVFRIKLLLLAVALALTGLDADKKDQQAKDQQAKTSVSNAKRSLSREEPKTTRKPQGRGILVVQRR